MSHGPDFNPYAAPDVEGPPTTEATRFEPRQCPRCGAEGATAAPYSRWHGRRGAKAIQDVICVECGVNFDGETGVEHPPRKNPIGCFLIALALFLLYFGGIFMLAMLGA